MTVNGDEPVSGAKGWRKSTHSNPSGDCVELATLADGSVGVRNSRFPAGAELSFDVEAMRDFVRDAKDGEFDHR